MNNFLLLIFVVFLCHNKVLAKNFSTKSFQIEKQKYELGIQKELQYRLRAVVPETHFILYTQIIPKKLFNPARNIVQKEINLGKLGLAPPIGPRKLKKRRFFLEKFSDNIRKIVINIILDESISKLKENQVKNVVLNLVNIVGKDRISLNVKRMVIVSDRKEIIIQSKIDRIKKFFNENIAIFYTVVTFLGISLIFFFFIYIIKKSTRAIGSVGDRILSFLENIYKIGHQGRDQPLSFDKPVSREEAFKQDIYKIKNDISFFVKCANERPLRLGILINKWIHEKPAKYEDGIAMIPHLIEHEAFGSILGSISEEVKKELSRIIGRDFSQIDLLSGKNFLQSFLPFMFSNQEESYLDKIILSLTTDESLEIMRREPSLGSLIIQSLPQEKVKVIMSKISKREMGKLIDSSISPESSKIGIESRLKELVESIRNDKVSTIPPTFLEHIVKQLREVSFERESGIFKMFRENDRTEVLFHISKEVFPSELILKLPSSIIKSVADSFSLREKAEILLSCPKESRDKLEQLMYVSRTREKKLFEAEVQMILSSTSESLSVTERSGEIWRGFVHAVRRHLKTDKEANQIARVVLEKWIYQDSSKLSKYSILKKAS